MSKLFDHVAEALGDPDNLDLLLATAVSEDRRQVVRSSQIVTREMLATLAELASDSSRADLVRRSLALVSDADDGGPIRLIPGRFEAAGASLARVLSQDAGRSSAATQSADPLVVPVAWLLAAAIGRHGPQPTDSKAMALFLEREYRRSIAPAPAPSKLRAVAPPSHRSTEPVRAPRPVAPVGALQPVAPVGALQPVAPVRAPHPVEPDPPAGAADADPVQLDEQDPRRDQNRDGLHAFARYALAVGVALWLLSVVLGPEEFNIVLAERAPTTTELPSAPGAFLPRFAPVPPTTSPDRSATPGGSDRVAGTRGTADPAAGGGGGLDLGAGGSGGSGGQDRPAGDGGDSGSRTAVDPLDVSFALVGPSGEPGATGTVEIVFDPAENQICHRFEIDGLAEPFGRIGIGRSAEQAGVVVDLGRLESGERACTQVSSTAMEALVAAENDHFVEVGDADRVQVARGQSTAVGTAAVVEAPEADTAVDPDVVSAGLSARPDVVTLAGAAPSRAIADLLRAELAILDGTGIEVIDQVTIDPTAGPPTGGIMIDQTDLFAIDSHDLSSDGEVTVRQLAILFLGNPEWAITVSGHTDSTGDEINNLELGLRRATEVRDILVAEGVSPDRITTEGVGAPFPIADNKTPEGRAKNRRFEIEIRRN